MEGSFFQRKVWLGFITAIGIITFLAVITFLHNRDSKTTSAWVAHTNSVLYHSEELLSLSVDMESGQRGFSLTGDETFLGPALHASGRIVGHAESLLKLTKDNPSQQERIILLERLVRQKLEFTLRAIDVRKNHGLDSARRLNASKEGKLLMEEIRAILEEIQEVEKTLLHERTELSESEADRFNRTFLVMLAATVLILVLLFYFIYVNLRARALAEAKVIEASGRIRDLYDNSPCGYHSVDQNGVFIEMNQTWLNWLNYNREEVIGKLRFENVLTDDSRDKYRSCFEKFKLEGVIKDQDFEAVRKDGSTFQILLNSSAVFGPDNTFLKSRSTILDFTEQKKAHDRIEQLNQELESFSYSVSHDLRAPLRSIDGYTQILIEDYSSNFDEEGRRVLSVIVSNARRMGQLIDDLLNFSRVGRKEVVKSMVNTDQLVRSVWGELSLMEIGRKIDVQISALHPCQADPNLLRQVWVNLISNALKYTRKKEEAVIRISSRLEDGNILYTVSDNGTGFDMLYAHKLFGVFQRLHRHKDFEGTGVGLAIVQRIINRHGGRIWAFAEVDKGATFYLSLPETIA